MPDQLRIYVGGLGSNVEEIDLKKTFTSPQLGAVQSVEIIRTKGRSFAYLEFLPVSDKGVAKLFSTYNGCSWKGGRLKLEKAKEDYLARLRREWAEDVENEIGLFSQSIEKDERMHTLQKPNKDDIEKMQLKIFFPKMRKIKSIPFKGTGKHKYSFQRIEVPPLPTHFCDCEEHSGHFEPPKRNYIDNEMDNYGVNENELNMMKSILSKLSEKENCSGTVIAEKKSNDAYLADTQQVDDSEEDQASGEDNLVINIVGSSRKRIASFEDWGQKTANANQNSSIIEVRSGSIPSLSSKRTEKGECGIQKKKKSIPEDKSDDKVCPKKKEKKWNQCDLVVENDRPAEKESGFIRLNDVKKSTKSAWKALVSEKGTSDFNISDIVMSLNPKVEKKPISLAACSDENGEELETLSDVPSFKNDESIASFENLVKKTATSDKNSLTREQGLLSNPASEMCGTANKHIVEKKRKQSIPEDKSTAKKKGKKLNLQDAVAESSQPVEKELGPMLCSNAKALKAVASDKEAEKASDKSGRGASWVQKSSWLQLVGDASSSAFSLKHIVPEAASASPLGGDEECGVTEAANATVAMAGFDGEVKGEMKDDGEANSDSKPSVDVDMSAYNRAVGDTVISESCPFMKSNASIKEWVKYKAALSESNNKKDKGKESR